MQFAKHLLYCQGMFIKKGRYYPLSDKSKFILMKTGLLNIRNVTKDSYVGYIQVLHIELTYWNMVYLSSTYWNVRAQIKNAFSMIWKLNKCCGHFPSYFYFMFQQILFIGLLETWLITSKMCLTTVNTTSSLMAKYTCYSVPSHGLHQVNQRDSHGNNCSETYVNTMDHLQWEIGWYRKYSNSLFTDVLQAIYVVDHKYHSW